MYRSRLRALFLCLFASTFLAAQEPWLQAPFSSKPADLLAAAAKLDHKGADVLLIFDDNRFEFDAEGRATRSYYMVFKVFSEAGAENWAPLSAGYEPWREHKPIIKARVISADGAVHMLDPKTLTDAPARNDTPNIFSDDRLITGPLPAVAPGAIVEQLVSIAESQPMLAFGHLYSVRFGAGVPSHLTRLVVDAPAHLPLRHSIQLLPGLVQDRKVNGGRVVLTFTHGRMESQDPAESHAPGDVPATPRIVVSTGKSWQAFAAEYGRVVDEKLQNADVRSFVEKARKEKDREAIISSLLRQLHETVRYTGVEFGEASIIPQPPSETLKRKYGDCKDKSALLIAMLRAAGIPAHFALLSTGPGEDSPPDLPGLGFFDHAIVYVPGSPAYWIDATADYSRLDQFPGMDQGRLALVIAPETQALVKTPELPSSANRLLQLREVFLAEKGPARFVEVTQPRGAIESAYRSHYRGGDPKEWRKGFEDYVKQEYASDRLVRFENTDARDFSAPFSLTLEAAEARRAFTTLYNSDVYVPIYGILSRLPDALTAEADEEEGQEDKKISERDKKKRQHDFVFDNPHITEWNYRVHVPAGFVVRAVPRDQVERFGPATLTTRFAREVTGGKLEGSFTFDSGKRRWSAAEVEEFREAFKKWKKTDNPHIAFSLQGTMLLEAGKVKEGLDALRSLHAQHPKEALHHIQFSYSLMDAGLGESARSEARRATQLEPTSADAFRALGWVLQHDLVGRRFGKGFDRAGALAAYRQALELEPKNNEVRVDYAILLEYDPAGVRYGAGADLAEALKQYQAVGDKLEDVGASDNPLYLRLHMRRFDELISELAKLPKSDARLALQLSAVAASAGSAAAIAEGSRLQSQGGTRMRVMASASQQLVTLRLYSPAADLLLAAVEGTDKAATEAGRARLLKTVVPFVPEKLDSDDPGTVVKSMFSLFMQEGEVPGDAITSFSSPDMFPTDPKLLQKLLRKSHEAMLQARFSMRQSGLELPVLRDIVMTLAQLNSDFDGVNTYRVRFTSPGATAQTFFATRIKGRLYLSGTPSDPDGVGFEILRRVDAGDTESVRKLLDWVREDVKIAGGEDPLAGPVLPRLWTRGQQASADELRALAAVIIAHADYSQPAIPLLEQAIARSVLESKKPFLQLALANAYGDTGRFADVAKIATQLRQSYPESLAVFNLSVTAFHATGDLAGWEALAQERLRRFSDDVDAIRSLARLAAVRGEVRKAISQRARLVEVGKADVSDYNSLSWDELFDGNITTKGLEYGEHGNLTTKSQNAPLLHTLAAVYAEVGKIAEAREMILKAMDKWGLEEPNSTCWYVFGRIAEQYGMTEDAIAAYRKVERPDYGWQIPNSTYQLAERRLAAIGATPSAPAKPASTKAAR